MTCPLCSPFLHSVLARMRPYSRVLLLALLALAPDADAQCQLQKLAGHALQPDDRFGIAVAIDGDLVAVAAHYHDYAGVHNGGKVDVFRRGAAGFAHEAEIGPPNGTGNSYFGNAIDLDGTTLVVGAYYADPHGSQSGTAYVFESTAAGWTLITELASPSLNGGDRFGSAVAIDGDRIAIGAPRKASGSVYVFERTGGTWQETERLTGGTASDAEFGASIDLQGDDLLIGAPGDDFGFPRTGGVYAYAHSGTGWNLQQAFAPASAHYRLEFASRLAFDGDWMIAYARDAPPLTYPPISTGGTYVFERTNGVWSEAGRLVPEHPQVALRFGYHLAIDGHAILCGSVTHAAGLLSGTAFLFEYDGVDWNQTASFLPPDASAEDLFAGAVAIDDGIAVVGAVGEDSQAEDAGAAYVYALFAGRAERYCPSAVNSSGLAGRISAEGALDVDAQDTVLRADQLPQHTWGLFVYGEPGPALPFGNGSLCVSPFAPGIFRLAPALATHTTGTAQRALDYSALPQGGAIAPGSTWSFQFWFRDTAGGGSQSNLTDALRITFCG